MSTLGAQLSIKGERRTGQDVRTQNVMAASSIANIVKVRIACEYHPNIFLRIFIFFGISFYKSIMHLLNISNICYNKIIHEKNFHQFLKNFVSSLLWDQLDSIR